MERQSTRRYRRGNHAPSLKPDRVSRGPRSQDAVLGRGDPQRHVETEEVPRGAARARRQVGAGDGRPIAHVARDLGIHSETLRKRVRQAEADQGLRPDLPTSEEREEIKRLRQENFELRTRERDPEVGERVFAKELDPDRLT
jgi:transposase